MVKIRIVCVGLRHFQAHSLHCERPMKESKSVLPHLY